MTYRGYNGAAEYDPETGEYHGKVLGIRDVVTFVGRTPEEAEREFRKSVDVYLEFCGETA